MSGAEDPRRAAELLSALAVYRPARQAFLSTLRLPASNRDPFAEFSEQLVHALMGGTLAASRVQVGHDLVLLDGQKVQVRYLANPGEAWVNEHFVHRIDGVPLYALVLFEAFTVTGVLVFPTTDLTEICAALGKRHPRQDETLQFTRRNFWTIREDADRFRQLGMRIWLPPLEFDEGDPVAENPFAADLHNSGGPLSNSERAWADSILNAHGDDPHPSS